MYFQHLSDPSITLRILTSKRNSFELVDYIDQVFWIRTEQINDSTYIYRNWNNTDTELVPEKDLAHWTRIPQFDVLGKVEVRHHQGKKEYYLKFPKFQTKPIPVSPKHPGIFTYPRIQIIVRDHPDNHPQYGFPLKVGNTIRLGQISMKILEMAGINHLAKNAKSPLTNYLKDYESKVFEAAQNIKLACKICLDDNQTEELICPCKCKGNIGSVHISCLQKWLITKIKKECTKYYAAWILKDISCQICKQKLPYMVTKNGRAFELVQIMRPLEPYIIFEIIDVNVYRNQSKSERNFTMFRFADKNKLKIGSNLGIEKCDILADSESISEPHAEFTLADGEFYVKDLKSRYGTFVETDEISPLKGVVRIQARKNVYEFILNQ